MPLLSKVELVYPFQRVLERHISSIVFEYVSVLDDCTMERRAYKTGSVSSLAAWNRLDSSFCSSVVENRIRNESNVQLLDLSRFAKLRELKVGDECFIHVNELRVIGLSELERVVIGENSFTKHKNGYGNDPNRHFYLKDCPKLKSLKMGRYSFSDYSVCEIENVDALEVIEIGKLNEESNNFYSASLQLSSVIVCVE